MSGAAQGRTVKHETVVVLVVALASCSAAVGTSVIGAIQVGQASWPVAALLVFGATLSAVGALLVAKELLQRDRKEP